MAGIKAYQAKQAQPDRISTMSREDVASPTWTVDDIHVDLPAVGPGSVTPSQGYALGFSPSSFEDQLDTLSDYADTLAMANGGSPEPRYSFSLDIGSVGPAIEPPYLPPTVTSLAGVTVTAPAAGLLSMMYADPSESPGLLTYDFSAVQRQEQLEAQAHAPVSAQDVAEFMKEQDIQFMTLPVSPLIGGFKSLVNFGHAALVRYGQFESVQALSQSAMYANSPEASSRMENEAMAAMNELNQSVPDTFTMSPVDRAGADALAIIGAGQMLLDAPTFISQVGTWIDRLSSPGVEVTIVPNVTVDATSNVVAPVLGASPTGSLPMTMETVQSYANQAGVNLDGLTVNIDDDPNLAGRGLFGYTREDGTGFDLYPDAFSNEQELVQTLGHERTHVFQMQTYGPPQDTLAGSLNEAAAQASESGYWQYFLQNTGR